VLLAGSIGCKKGLVLVPVSGSVKLDGKPVVECAVVFQPIAAGPAASGTTDGDGRFTLMTINQSGAVPGEHRVLLTKQRYIKTDNHPYYEFLTPKKYALPDTSGLKATVGNDSREFVFEMSSR
jgi:hypothetical protein